MVKLLELPSTRNVAAPNDDVSMSVTLENRRTPVGVIVTVPLFVVLGMMRPNFRSLITLTVIGPTITAFALDVAACASFLQMSNTTIQIMDEIILFNWNFSFQLF
jgi:hypothetical protein